MDQQQLKNVLDMHRKWVLGEPGGERADLRSANLRYADLRYADLRYANLRYADLRYANLRSADLRSADLSSADLSSADLSSADLRSADLRSADLSSANLRYADLRYADLRYANLSSADLSSADLRYANLRYANLRSADLSSADLKPIKDDFFNRLKIAKAEVIGLYDHLMRGKINGQVYQGECACFVGTIANLRKEDHLSLTIDLKPDADSPTEKWFLAIRKGDTPENNSVAKITSEWMEEFIKTEGLVIPKYKIISTARIALQKADSIVGGEK